jgi:hypothetical protein
LGKNTDRTGKLLHSKANLRAAKEVFEDLNTEGKKFGQKQSSNPCKQKKTYRTES